MFNFIGDVTELESFLQSSIKTDVVNIITHQADGVKGKIIGMNLDDMFDSASRVVNTEEMKKIIIVSKGCNVDVKEDDETYVFRQVTCFDPRTPIGNMIMLYYSVYNVPLNLKIAYEG